MIFKIFTINILIYFLFINQVFAQEIFLEIPDIEIEVQSGIDYSTGNIWVCPEKGDGICKINLNIEKIFTGSFNNSDYLCNWNFSGGIFSDGTQNKCNPGYVDYSNGIFDIFVQVIDKNDPLNFKTGGIVIHNLEEENTSSEISSSGYIEQEQNSSSGEILEENNSNTGTLTNSGEIVDKNNLSNNEEVEQEEIFEENEVNTNSGELIDEINTSTGVLINTGEINQENEEEVENIESNSGEIIEENTSSEISSSQDIEQEQNSSSGEIIDENSTNTGEIIENQEELENNNKNIESNSGELLEENENNTNTGEITEENNTSTGTLKSIGEINQEIEKNQKVVYGFQNPTYLLEEDKEFLDSENIVFNCDRTKTECKINLDFRDSFSGDILEKDYLCSIDFGFMTGEEEKCNPNTIIVPVGTFDFDIKIENKLDNSIFSSLNFKVINEGYLEVREIIATNSSSSNNSTSNNNSSSNVSSTNSNNYNYINIQQVDPDINILSPEIIIQSGLDETNNCIKTDCKVNLIYESKHNNELCEWNFSGGFFKDGTQNKCNPGYVDYSLGEYEIKLKVYQKNKEYNFKESILKFSNKQIEEEENLEPHPNPLLQEREQDEEQDIEQRIVLDYENLKKVKIFKVMPNPKGTDTLEYIELINNSDSIVNLKGCSLDDKIDGGSKVFTFKEDSFIKIGNTKKIYKSETSLNLNNDTDEVYFFCNDLNIDNLSRNFPVKDGYYLDHSRLNIKTSIVKVVDVTDGDTLKVQFSDSGNTEKLRLIGVDTPETKHPNKDVERFGIEAYNFTKNSLLGKEVKLEIDPNNYRDKYSRLLGFVYLGDKNFNKELISLGYAKAYLDYYFNYIKDFENAQKEAKKQKLGIWSVDEEFKEEEPHPNPQEEPHPTPLLQEREQKQDINNKEEEIEQKIVLDENNNNIPDEFEEFILDENNDKKLILDEKKSKEKYNSFVDLGFTQKVSKLKSGIKIYGETIPNSKIFLEIEEKKNIGFINFFIKKASANYFYATKSDDLGKYELLITDFIVGDFDIKTNIIDDFGNNFEISKNKELSLDIEYTKDMQTYVYEKTIKAKEKFIGELIVNKSSILGENNIENEQEQNSKNIKVENNQELKSIINLQGKIGTNKFLNQNILTCIDTCSVNFDGSSSEGNIDKYIWDFGNNNIFKGQNPGYEKYENFGYYKVSLKVIGKDLKENTSYFYVNFISKKDLEIEEETSSQPSPKGEGVNKPHTSSFLQDSEQDEEKKEEQEEVEQEKASNFKEMFAYVLVVIFSFTLLLLLLRKEKVI